MEKILISKDNLSLIIKGFANDLYNKVNNKNLATPYLDKINKAGLLKTDGNGDMFLCNNGEYIKIDLNQISITEDMINTIYDLFKISSTSNYNNKTLKPMLRGRCSSMSVIYNNKIYTIAGKYGDNQTEIVEIYDIATNTSTYGSNLFMRKQGVAGTIYNGKIYCTGGAFGFNTYKSNDIYDIATNTWSSSIEMPVATSMHSVEYTNNKIYCIGGNTTEVQIFDLLTNTWQIGTRCDIAISYFGLKYYKNKLYCMGGNSGTVLDTIKIYDIKTNTWETSKKMNAPNHGFGCAIYKDDIYCICGSNGKNITNTTNIYNITTDTWRDCPVSTLHTKYVTSTCINNNIIYCLGSYSEDPNIDTIILPYTTYDIKLPEELDNKLNIIKNDGDGNKLLFDNGLYINPSDNYNCMKIEDINSLISEINTENGGN